VQPQQERRLELASHGVPPAHLHLQPPLEAVVRWQLHAPVRDLGQLRRRRLVKASQRLERFGLQREVNAVEHLIGGRADGGRAYEDVAQRLYAVLNRRALHAELLGCVGKHLARRLLLQHLHRRLAKLGDIFGRQVRQHR